MSTSPILAYIYPTRGFPFFEFADALGEFATYAEANEWAEAHAHDYYGGIVLHDPGRELIDWGDMVTDEYGAEVDATLDD